MPSDEHQDSCNKNHPQYGDDFFLSVVDLKPAPGVPPHTTLPCFRYLLLGCSSGSRLVFSHCVGAKGESLSGSFVISSTLDSAGQILAGINIIGR